MKGARQGAAIAITACALLAWTGSARASGEPAFHCAHVRGGEAAVNPNPEGLPPIALGDSTMLLPIPDLNQVGYSVNARGCRGFLEAIGVAQKLRKRHRLPHLVLIAAYGNGGVNPNLIKLALRTIGPSRVLALVTSYNADTGAAPAPDTGILFKARRQHPNQVLVLDWVRHSLRHHVAEPEPGAWFISDLFHPNFDGAAAYATFLARALRYAVDGNFPG